MVKAKPATIEEEVDKSVSDEVEETGDETVKAKPLKKGATSVKVIDANGDLVRVYSEKDHGDDFASLAKEFAGKVPGRKIE